MARVCTTRALVAVVLVAAATGASAHGAGHSHHHHGPARSLRADALDEHTAVSAEEEALLRMYHPHGRGLDEVFRFGDQTVSTSRDGPLKAGEFRCGVGHPTIDAELNAHKPYTVPQEYPTLHGPEVRRELAERSDDEIEADAGLRRLRELVRQGEDKRAAAAPVAGAAADAAAAGGAPQEGKARGLASPKVSQTYPTATGGGFLAASNAAATSIVKGIRIKAIWDVVTNYDHVGQGNARRQCTDKSQTLSVTRASGSGLELWGPSDSDAPTDEDCMPGDTSDARFKTMKKRTDWAIAKFADMIKVVPISSGSSISIHNGIKSAFNIPTSFAAVSDADLVLIMTARPSRHVALNGYAACLQWDQYGRCTVGQFNWVPNAVPSADEGPETVNAQRHTALHEIVHVLGGIGPAADISVFVTDTGAPQTSVYRVDPKESDHYAKETIKIVTPKVVKAAQDHFGCATLDGVPIEDQPTGRGSHWEARIFGPELMSYGTGTGETYIGDITLAYLEDSNQYVANYSAAGRLLVAAADTGRKSEFEAVETTPPASVPAAPAPGQLRWGRAQGCGFVEKSAKEWSTEYRCGKHREFGCSFDHRLSSVCMVLTTWQLAGGFSCGKCSSSASTYCYPSCPNINDNCDAATGVCGLPSMYQYFDATTALEAIKGTGLASVNPGKTGGFSSAMDHAPVRLGYWNCQDTKPGNGSSLSAAQSGSKFSLSSVTSGAEGEQRLFGGQAYCPTCRCFVSSLMDFSSGKVNSNFPTYGLCYRMNCFKADYLQFAIEGQLGSTTWYKCPKEGGKIYIAGFSGAFHCPKAEDFCRFEAISGERYKETDPLWEWIFWGTVTMLPLLTLLICAIPCVRRFCVERSKVWCGVNHFNRRGKLDLDAEVDDDEEAEKPPKPWGHILMCSNALVFFFALVGFLLTVAGIVSGRVSIAAFMLITGSLTVMAFSAIGAFAGNARTRGTSCLAVVYFFSVYCAFWMFVFACLYAMAFPASMGKILEKQWPKISSTLPEGVVQDKLAEGEGEDVLAKWAGAAAGAGLFMLVLLVLELTAAAKVVTMPVIASTMYTVINWFFVVAGLGMWGVAGYASRFEDIGAEAVVGTAAFAGFYLVFAGIFAIVASHKKTVKWLAAAMGVSCLTFIFALAVSAALFAGVSNIDSALDALSDKQVATVNDALGLNGGKAEIAEAVKNNVRTLGMFGIMMILMLLCMVASNAYFVHKVRMHYRKVGVRGAAGSWVQEDTRKPY